MDSQAGKWKFVLLVVYKRDDLLTMNKVNF